MNGRYETPLEQKWLRRRIGVLLRKNSVGVMDNYRDGCPDGKQHDPVEDDLVVPYKVVQQVGEPDWPWLICHYRCPVDGQEWISESPSYGAPWDLFCFVEPTADTKPVPQRTRRLDGAVYVEDCPLGCQWHPRWL